MAMTPEELEIWWEKHNATVAHYSNADSTFNAAFYELEAKLIAEVDALLAANPVSESNSYEQRIVDNARAYMRAGYHNKRDLRRNYRNGRRRHVLARPCAAADP